MDVQEKYVLALSKEIKESLRWYTSGEYKEFNVALRSGEFLSVEDQMHMNNIEKAFAGVPPLTLDIDVFRGVQKKEAILPDLNTFISTSVDEKVALEFAGEEECCILQLKVVEGSKVLPVSALSDSAWEKEVLLPLGTKIKIISDAYDSRRGVEWYVGIVIPPTAISLTEKTTPVQVERKLSVNEWVDSLKVRIDVEELELYSTVEEVIEAVENTIEIPPLIKRSVLARFAEYLKGQSHFMKFAE